MHTGLIRVQSWPFLAFLLVPSLISCDGGPGAIAGAEGVGDAGYADAVEAGWASLITEEEVHLSTLDALMHARSEASRALVLSAGLLSAEAVDLERVGSSGLAAELDEEVALEWSGTALAVLGDGLLDGIVDGPSELIRALDGLPVDDAARARIRRARSHLERARIALDRGHGRVAVHEAGRAAHALRGFAPERRARAYVAAALELLGKARELARASPRDGVASWLSRAADRCDTAKDALADGEWRGAVRAAGACLRLSRRIISVLMADLGETDAADRAGAMIDRAGGLLARARRAVGDDPPAAVREGLGEARSLLALARRAFEAGRYREAIRSAYASARLSRRILSWAGAGDGVRAGGAG